MTDVNISTGRVLRYGVVIGLIIISIGMAAEFVSEDAGMPILEAGIATIIFTHTSYCRVRFIIR